MTLITNIHTHTRTHALTHRQYLLFPSSLSHLILSQRGFKRTLAQQWPVTCHSGSQPSHRRNIDSYNISKQTHQLPRLHLLPLPPFPSYLSLSCYLFYQRWSALNDKYPLDISRSAETLGITLFVLLIKLEREEGAASSLSLMFQFGIVEHIWKV